MEGEDLRAIEAWLADAAYTAPKKTPQPHQAEALDVLPPALQTHNRVSAIMACGTGKTLLALWIAEAVTRASTPAGSGGVPAARILVLVPSLALLRQTLHEWLRETSLPNLAYLCVCSDPTVKEGLDALTTTQSDLDFQVSTNAASVRGFLDAPFAGVKLVFSTYQSASVVGAAMQPGEAFDFAVFDEAPIRSPAQNKPKRKRDQGGRDTWPQQASSRNGGQALNRGQTASRAADHFFNR